MKSKIKDQSNGQPQKNEFPHLGIYANNTIVLFYAPNKGISIHNENSCNPIGTLSLDWASNYDLFRGELIISN